MKHERRIKTKARQIVTAADLRFLLDNLNRPGAAADAALALAGVTEAEMAPDPMRERLWTLLRHPLVQARRTDLRVCALCGKLFFANDDREQYCSPACCRKAHRPAPPVRAEQMRTHRAKPETKMRAKDRPGNRRKRPSRNR